MHFILFLEFILDLGKKGGQTCIDGDGGFNVLRLIGSG